MTRYEQSTYRVPVTIKNTDDELVDVSSDDIKYVMATSKSKDNIVVEITDSDSAMDLTNASNGEVVITIDSSDIPDEKLIEELRIKGTDDQGRPYNTVVMQRSTNFYDAITDASDL